MARVKIKCRSNTKETKLALIEILCRKDVEISRIITIKDGFVVLTVNEHSADSVFNRDTKNDLTSKGFTPLMPPELKARKSVIILRVDDVIWEYDEDEIKEEIVNRNSWIGEELETVYKFSNTNTQTIKLTFSLTAHAKRCTEIGIKACGISIPGHAIKIETYIPIKCCMRCYALEDHFTNECSLPSSYKICSECSTEGHLWHECKEQSKTCLNCGENHRTMAMKCSKRREIIKTKRQEMNTKQNTTYATIAQHQTQQQIPMPKMPQITKEELLKINICVAHAHGKDQKNPGTYAYELDRTLKANNLPQIIIPDDEDTNVTGQTTGATSLPEIHPLKPAARRHSSSDLCRQSNSSDLNKSQDSAINKQIEAADLGLEFYTVKESNWPQNFSTDDLLKGIRTNKCKWKYSHDKYTEERVLKKIQRGEITLQRCWFTVDNDEFRKIRSGQQQERSPMHNRDPRLSKKSHHEQS